MPRWPLYAAVRIWFDGERRLRVFLPRRPVRGLAGGRASCRPWRCWRLVAAALLWKAPRPTLLGFLPAGLLVAAAFFGTNWIAHRQPQAGLSAPQSRPTIGTTIPTSATAGRSKAIGTIRWASTRASPRRAVYALHCWSAITASFRSRPMWLLSLAGMFRWLSRRGDRRLRWPGGWRGRDSLACLVFYLIRPLQHRNYGGMSSGLRWMFWFAPLWLVTMLPAADAGPAALGPRLGLVLLGLSVLSVSYPTWNPWTHPWLSVFSQYLGGTA